MLIIPGNEGLLSRQDVWFYEGERIPGVCVSYFYFSFERPARKVDALEASQTCVVDLSKTEQELLDAVKSSCRYEIRRAEKEKATAEIIAEPAVEQGKDLIRSYNAFAAKKGLAALVPGGRLDRLLESKCVTLTRAFDKDRNEIVTHVYVHDSAWVRLLYSYHNLNFNEESLRGYSNRFLHCRDLIYLKSAGYRLYDFGGFNMAKHPGISQFKLAFGGSVVKNYCYGITWPAARLLVQARKFLSNRGLYSFHGGIL